MATGRPIDHVVLAVADLDAAAAVFENEGFTLTPRASHPDRMGTSNRLVQFRGRNAIEVLTVDRPDRLARHDFSQAPAFFSFGDHQRLSVGRRDGLSMLVFASDDAGADMRRFQAAGLPTFQPFDFERTARLPDGVDVAVRFTLAYTVSPDMPAVAFAVCQNRAPELLWKAGYQAHANGARMLRAVYLASDAPDRDAAFIAAMFGGATAPLEGGGVSVACGRSQEVRVVSLPAVAARDPSFAGEVPVLAGIGVAADAAHGVIPASRACGMFLEWVGRNAGWSSDHDRR